MIFIYQLIYIVQICKEKTSNRIVILLKHKANNFNAEQNKYLQIQSAQKQIQKQGQNSKGEQIDQFCFRTRQINQSPFTTNITWKFLSYSLMNELYHLRSMNNMTNRSAIRIRKLCKFATDRDEPFFHELHQERAEPLNQAHTSFMKKIKSQLKKNHAFLTETQSSSQCESEDKDWTVSKRVKAPGDESQYEVLRKRVKPNEQKMATVDQTVRAAYDFISKMRKNIG